ncbi:alpha/beta hydrolase [Thalassospira sp. ER-Se-21-Dark]|uniref:alpha/beta fold hydrolase n=1 Tax=Thalassospira sp. ER-Se-21-Dark TaxID=2585190 RepID=UPI001B307357|nr:alpha/beta hydrolase [Thalassospira sp. ER-Se-21-Dark]MBP3125736.1 alpha/beta hydrolase [Thalassospira sp. ER-Se-21-Dark]
MKNKILNIAAAIALSLVSATSAQADDKTADGNSIRNVVLVHGAFADGSGWRGVYNDLTARGYNVTIVQNPLTSLADDVAATKRALDRQDGPTVLVGHSWGGTVITEAGIDPKVAALVYVAALAPDAGETTGQLYEGYATSPEFVLDIHTDGYAFVEPEKFKQGFANDVSDADAAFMRDSQVPINLKAFETKLQNAAWRTKPSWAVYGTEDKAFDPEMLAAMAERINAKVTKVSASHSIFMTQPKVVADTIDQAAKATNQ